MLKNKIVILVFTVIILMCTAVCIEKARSSINDRKILLIGIQKDQPYVTFSTRYGVRITDLFTMSSQIVGGNGVSMAVYPSKNGIRMGTLVFGRIIRIMPVESGDLLVVGKKRYRDVALIQLNRKGKLDAINEVGIENYLYGVIPAEISSSWPIEALKAQAVAARTYAMQNVNHKHTKDGYDLCSSFCCQVYPGVINEALATNKAVDITAGEGLFYGETLITAYFHNSCGGSTENVGNVWGTEKVPGYLRGVECKNCDAYPKQQWSTVYTGELMSQRLTKKGYNIGKIVKVVIQKKSEIGRVIVLELTDNKGKTVSINSNHFRMAVGSNSVRSTMFTVNYKNGKFVFSGRGWGHGVGLCQWGALGLAKKGMGYKEILQFYYPGTGVKRCY
ncbi:MAG: SpoIID/LytB domain-containing protein [Elusimicrobiota bacterium]